MSDSSAKKTPEYIRDYRLADAFDTARKSGGKYLSLRDMDLKEIPKQVWSFKNLESLDLSSNKLRSVPGLTELRRLKSVNLVQNPIEDLPNLPGLKIDDGTYFRLRSRIYHSNVTGLVVSGKLFGLDEDDWLSEIHSLSNLRELTIGSWPLKVGAQH